MKKRGICKFSKFFSSSKRVAKKREEGFLNVRESGFILKFNFRRVKFKDFKQKV